MKMMIQLVQDARKIDRLTFQIFYLISILSPQRKTFRKREKTIMKKKKLQLKILWASLSIKGRIRNNQTLPECLDQHLSLNSNSAK